MNERIKELVLEAGFVHYGEDQGFYNIPVPAFNSRMEKFAELIVRECCQFENSYSGDARLVSRHYIRRIREHFGVSE